jgi:hypothetical protein
MDAIVRIRTHRVGLAVGSVFASAGPWLHSIGRAEHSLPKVSGLNAPGAPAVSRSHFGAERGTRADQQGFIPD